MIIIAKKAIVSQKLSESHPLSECSILIGRENKSGFDFWWRCCDYLPQSFLKSHQSPRNHFHPIPNWSNQVLRCELSDDESKIKILELNF